MVSGLRGLQSGGGKATRQKRERFRKLQADFDEAARHGTDVSYRAGGFFASGHVLDRKELSLVNRFAQLQERAMALTTSVEVSSSTWRPFGGSTEMRTAMGSRTRRLRRRSAVLCRVPGVLTSGVLSADHVKGWCTGTAKNTRAEGDLTVEPAGFASEVIGLLFKNGTD